MPKLHSAAEEWLRQEEDSDSIPLAQSRPNLMNSSSANSRTKFWAPIEIGKILEVRL